jgi:hypothetical protein
VEKHEISNLNSKAIIKAASLGEVNVNTLEKPTAEGPKTVKFEESTQEYKLPENHKMDKVVLN